MLMKLKRLELRSVEDFFVRGTPILFYIRSLFYLIHSPLLLPLEVQSKDFPS